MNTKLNEKDLKKSGNKLIRGIVFGLLAGILCLLVWSRVTVRFGHNPFWYQPMLGLILGIAVAFGSGFSKKSGVCAVIISLITLIAGKYINTGIEMNLTVRSEKINEIITPLFGRDETMIAVLAEDIVQSRIASGDSLLLPSPNNPYRKYPQNRYPFEIWNKASQVWNSLSDSNQQKFRSVLSTLETEKIRNHLIQNRHDLHGKFFKESFKGMHLLYGLLTLGSAFIIPVLLEISAGRKKERRTLSNEKTTC
jgi:hypothetical protein